MRKLLLSAAALLALTTASYAAPVVVSDLGADPTSASGNFIQSLNGVTTPFSDEFTFSLTHASNFVIAGVQNSFAQTSDFISNFGASVFNVGADGTINTADDFAVIIGGPPVACQFNPNCQVIAGSAFLPGGSYYVDVTGTGGGTSGFQGGVAAVAAVPEPSTWAMMLLGFAGIVVMGAKNRRRNNGTAFRLV
jgi:hypothetical protein